MAIADQERPEAIEERPITLSQRFWAEVRGYAEAIVIAFFIVTFVFTTVGVVGSSMRPNLNGGSGGMPQALFTGDRVFIPKFDTWLRRAGILGAFRRGDIVVIREPENAPSAQGRGRRPFFIKRLVAVPGDYIRIVEGQIILNGQPLDQGFITGSGEIHPDPINFPVIEVHDGVVTGFQGLVRGTFSVTMRGLDVVSLERPAVQLHYGGVLESLAPLPEDAPEGVPFVHDMIVPEGQYFVVGDNRQSARGGSEDSRYFGPIPALSVAGRATAVIWPPSRDGELNWRVLRPPAAFEAVPNP